MQKTIVITDLTTMGGDRVCIVGIDQDSRCIRPVLPPPGVLRKHLYIRKYIIFEKLAICPRAKIKFDFHQVPLKPPHIEDLGFDSNSISYQGFCDDAEWEAVLQASSFHSVQDIYDGLLQEPRWVAPGANTRSLGTVSRTQVTNVRLQEWSGRRKYRLCFVDDVGHKYDDVIISDMASRTFLDAEVSRVESPMVAATHVKDLLRDADRLYLRLGLARPWLNPNTNRMECWMQVTGIYTFPDYLEGKTFADF